MAATAPGKLNNYFAKPEPVFIERYSDLPTTIDKRRLYELSDAAFEEFRLKSKTLEKAVNCTEAEVQAIQQYLQDTEGQLKLESFSFVGDIKCVKCTRQLNYFDVFKTAVKFHGVEFLKWTILGPTKQINLAPLTKEQMLYCSNCDHVWSSKAKRENEKSGYCSYVGGNGGYLTVVNEELGYCNYFGGNGGYLTVLNE